VLPEDFNNLPIFWDEEALGWLKGSVLVQQIKDRKANIRSDYDAICAALPEFRCFSFKEFLWCRTAVGSRNFSIVVHGEKRTAMVPQADMLNHLRPRECSWTFDNAANSFVIRSLTKIPDTQGRAGATLPITNIVHTQIFALRSFVRSLC